MVHFHTHLCLSTFLFPFFFPPDLLPAAAPLSLKSLHIISTFLFIFYFCFFLSCWLFHIFFGLSLLFMSPSSRMSWDIRSRMPASAAPGRWLSPHPILSLYLQPPEYIKTLYLFHLYVNAPSHSFLLCSPVAAENVPPFAPIFLSAQLDSPEMRCGRSHGSVEMLFYDHARSPSSPSVTHQVSACGFLITSAAFYCQYLWGFILLDVLYSAVVNCMAALYSPCPWSFKQ